MRYLEGCTLTAFTRGSRTLVLQIKATGYKPTWSHAGVLAVGTWLFWPTVGPLIPAGLTTAATLWLLAAMILGNASAPTDEDVVDTAADSTPDDAGEDGQEEPASTAPSPADARHAVALLGARGTHVALTAVTAQLAAQHPSWERSGKATKALLQGAGIRYRAGVKVDGVSVPGVHRDDVPPLPSPCESAPESVVVAGQSNNNNHNNASERPTREGFVMRADPDNPAHTIVVSQTTAA